jgi:hypothetical protein
MIHAIADCRIPRVLVRHLVQIVAQFQTPPTNRADCASGELVGSGFLMVGSVDVMYSLCSHRLCLCRN